MTPKRSSNLRAHVGRKKGSKRTIRSKQRSKSPTAVGQITTSFDDPIKSAEYVELLQAIKQRFQRAQVDAIFKVNAVLTQLYWELGKLINEKQETYGWGKAVIESLALDLQQLFPGIAGFSRTNLFNIRLFYETYHSTVDRNKPLQELAIFNIPWGHNVILLQKLKSHEQRLWYAERALQHGWSRTMLNTWITSKLYKREGKAVTNFKNTLPAPHSDIAQQTLKDPYIFDFLTLQYDHREQDLEKGLIRHAEELLLEMGKGFSLVARQYHFEIDGQDFYIDLLFYHLTLRCYVVVELKARSFDPRDTGQINFYLSAIDDLVRHPDDAPTIGLLLCKTKNTILAEYALRSINKPIGVAGYEVNLISKLPQKLKSSLPTIEEIEREFEKKERLVATSKAAKKST